MLIFTTPWKVGSQGWPAKQMPLTRNNKWVCCGMPWPHFLKCLKSIDLLIDTSDMKLRLAILCSFKHLKKIKSRHAKQNLPVQDISQSTSTLVGLVILLSINLHHLLELSFKTRSSQNGSLTNNRWECCGLPRHTVSQNLEIVGQAPHRWNWSWLSLFDFMLLETAYRGWALQILPVHNIGRSSSTWAGFE